MNISQILIKLKECDPVTVDLQTPDKLKNSIIKIKHDCKKFNLYNYGLTAKPSDDENSFVFFETGIDINVDTKFNVVRIHLLDKLLIKTILIKVGDNQEYIDLYDYLPVIKTLYTQEYLNKMVADIDADKYIKIIHKNNIYSVLFFNDYVNNEELVCIETRVDQ